MSLLLIRPVVKARRGEGAQSVTPLEEILYLFTFLRSGVEAKHGIKFRHSTRNASRTRLKVGNGVP